MAIAVALSANALADDAKPAAATCYELSADGKTWSDPVERLCVSILNTGWNADVTLELATPSPAIIAAYHLDVVPVAPKTRADRNVSKFTLTRSSVVVSALEIVFNGHRDVAAGTETGTVSIGGKKLFYRLGR